MSTLFAYITVCWSVIIGSLAFLATNTSLGAWISHLSVVLGRKLRSWGLKWPEPPASADLIERREAYGQLLVQLEENRKASNAVCNTLRQMMEQNAKHHEEITRRLLALEATLSQISYSAGRHIQKTDEFAKTVRAVAAFEVDRLLRKLSQSNHEANTEPRTQHLRAASA